MKRNKTIGLICMTAVISLAGGTQAFSQADAQQPPRDGGNRPPRGGRGGGQGGPATLVRTPVKALASALKLTSDQTTAIQKIQADFQAADKANRPAPPDPNGGGTPPDRATMDANRAKSQQLEKTANESILALLTDSQKTAAASLLRLLPALREAGIPLEVLGNLSLTDDQKTQIAAVVKADRDAANGDMSRELHDKIHTDVMALLSSDQQATLTAYLKAHPQTKGGPGGGPGGPGGFGGGPDGGGPGGGGQGGRPHRGGPGGPGGGQDNGGQPGGPDGQGGPGEMPPPPDGGRRAAPRPAPARWRQLNNSPSPRPSPKFGRGRQGPHPGPLPSLGEGGKALTPALSQTGRGSKIRAFLSFSQVWEKGARAFRSNLYQNRIAFYFDCVFRHALRGSENVARANVNLPGVPGTKHAVALNIPVAERPVLMRTFVVNAKVFAVQIEQRILPAPRLHGFALPRRQFRRRRYLLKRHASTPVFLTAL